MAVIATGQPLDPAGGLAGELEADVAARRQPGQGEAGWGVGQDAAGDGGHGVVAGVVGDGHRAVPPHGRELLGEHSWRGQQAGNQHDREWFVHFGDHEPARSLEGVADHAPDAAGRPEARERRQQRWWPLPCLVGGS
jgi:hypothetical protein